MDITDRFLHYSPAVRQLIRDAGNAWVVWDRRPYRNAKGFLKWEKEFKKAMNDLGATLMLFGIPSRKEESDGSEEDK